MTERRYTEEEVAAIIERAPEAQQSGRRQLPAGEGMTLADLQEIGKEIGVTPELIAHAARSIEQAGQPTARQFLGLPIGVGRTVDLDRRLSEEEWERLVVDLPAIPLLMNGGSTASSRVQGPNCYTIRIRTP